MPILIRWGQSSAYWAVCCSGALRHYERGQAGGPRVAARVPGQARPAHHVWGRRPGQAREYYHLFALDSTAPPGAIIRSPELGASGRMRHTERPLASARPQQCLLSPCAGCSSLASTVQPATPAAAATDWANMNRAPLGAFDDRPPERDFLAVEGEYSTLERQC